MQLSKKERVFLINQYEILKVLNPKEGPSYDELIEIIRNGYEIFYSDINNWLSEDMPREQGKFVLNVLDLYRAIENYKSHHTDDGEVSSHLWSTFRGFDGNNETAYMAFTRFLIHKQKKFAEQRQSGADSDDFNSHAPTLQKYRPMVAKWEDLGRSFELSHEDILEILNASPSP